MGDGAPLRIAISRGYGDCDLCGGYNYGSIVVTRGGEVVFRDGWDGHLGAGDMADPDNDAVAFLRQVLAAIGVEAEVVETDGEDDA